MNIFILSNNPFEAASEMCDSHVVKMPTESCQMLHTNVLFKMFKVSHGWEPSLKQLKEFHAESMYDYLMKPAMLNHPCTIWARQSQENHAWLYDHAIALCNEYTNRYNKIHGTERRIKETPEPFFSKLGLTPFAKAMPELYKQQCPIESYRTYYIKDKWEFATWRNGAPNWWPQQEVDNKRLERRMIY